VWTKGKHVVPLFKGMRRLTAADKIVYLAVRPAAWAQLYKFQRFAVKHFFHAVSYVLRHDISWPFAV
jgi:hypothetical protein